MMRVDLNEASAKALLRRAVANNDRLFGANNRFYLHDEVSSLALVAMRKRVESQIVNYYYLFYFKPDHADPRNLVRSDTDFVIYTATGCRYDLTPISSEFIDIGIIHIGVSSEAINSLQEVQVLLRSFNSQPNGVSSFHPFPNSLVSFNSLHFLFMDFPAEPKPSNMAQASSMVQAIQTTEFASLSPIARLQLCCSLLGNVKELVGICRGQLPEDMLSPSNTFLFFNLTRASLIHPASGALSSILRSQKSPVVKDVNPLTRKILRRLAGLFEYLLSASSQLNLRLSLSNLIKIPSLQRQGEHENFYIHHLTLIVHLFLRLLSEQDHPTILFSFNEINTFFENLCALIEQIEKANSDPSTLNKGALEFLSLQLLSTLFSRSASQEDLALFNCLSRYTDVRDGQPKRESIFTTLLFDPEEYNKFLELYHANALTHLVHSVEITGFWFLKLSKKDPHHKVAFSILNGLAKMHLLSDQTLRFFLATDAQSINLDGKLVGLINQLCYLHQVSGYLRTQYDPGKFNTEAKHPPSYLVSLVKMLLVFPRASFILTLEPDQVLNFQDLSWLRDNQNNFFNADDATKTPLFNPVYITCVLTKSSEQLAKEFKSTYNSHLPRTEKPSLFRKDTDVNAKYRYEEETKFCKEVLPKAQYIEDIEAALLDSKTSSPLGSEILQQMKDAAVSAPSHATAESAAKKAAVSASSHAAAKSAAELSSDSPSRRLQGQRALSAAGGGNPALLRPPKIPAATGSVHSGDKSVGKRTASKNSNGGAG